MAMPTLLGPLDLMAKLALETNLITPFYATILILAFVIYLQAFVSFSLRSSGMDVDKPIIVLMQFFVVEHQLSCGLSNSIMEVLSLPIFIQPLSLASYEGNEGNGMQLRNLCEVVQASCIRRLDIPGREKNSVYALESPGLLGIGGKIWDSSFVLIRYLAHHRNELITAKNVLELGSGTGVTGIVLLLNVCRLILY